ncbi:MAG TPA: PQQ-dependent sugar dehydrogenase [Xanthobacteraceae bacterium]|nr:PQQ-dependent sugar dehydrogenase [Xanthobacteraceae bacterium]
MMPRSVSTRSLLLAGTIAAVLAVAGPASAQQPAEPAVTGATPAPPPLPPGSPLIGRPDTEAAMKLAPVVPPPLAAPPDKLAADKLKLPKGFHVEVYASGIPDAREMRIGDKGTLFVGNRLQDKVWAIYEKDGKRVQKPIVTGMHRPNGVAFHEGTLYFAELSKIWKLEKIEDNLDNPPKPTLVYDDLPSDEAHGWKFISIGPDNKLYVPVGQPCNNCIPDDRHGQIRRMNLDGTGAEVVARGVRNTVGFDWHPVTHELYFTDNGRDWMSEDLPNDELNRVTKVGQHFGSPYCYQGNIPDPQFGWGHSCSEFVPPVALMGPHAAALGMRFYTGTMFPSEYRGAIFVARHGSWNRTNKFGGDIAVVKLNKDGTVKSVEPFITGFLVDNKYIGRPVDVQPMKDGSLLISDDYDGAIYRVTYGNAKTAAVH